MPSRFLNNITINDEYTLPSADGTADQIITTDGAGQLGFVDQSTISAGNAEHVVIYAKNTSGSQIDKGTPVYMTGTVGATDTIKIAPADAGNASHMPAVGLLDETLINNAFGYVITGGFMDNITTDPIDGATPASNDTVYVKVGGGLTLTKPTGPTGLIQNVAKVGKVSGGNSGSLIVSSILRTNDVPNLPEGRIWVGDGNTIVSDTVYVDEPNNRVGIGTTTPFAKLHITESTSNNYAKIRLQGSNRGGIIEMYNGLSNPVSSWTTDQSGNTYFATSGMLGGISLSNRLTILTAGNVGIGTTSPYGKLDVAGNIRLQSANQIYFGGTGSIPYWTVGVDNTTNNNFVIGGNSYYLYDRDILLNPVNNGKVGIGTTSPGAKLEVVGTTGVIIDSGSNSGALLTLKGDGSDYGGGAQINVIGGALDYLYYATNINRSPGTPEAIEKYEMYGHKWTWDGNMGGTAGQPYTSYDFKSQGSSQMVIYNNNVGIGTTGPSEKLHVRAADPSVLIENTLYGSGESTLVFKTAMGAKNYLACNSNNALNYKNTSGSSIFTIKNSGDVGIGTTNPSVELQVGNFGSAETPEIIVAGGASSQIQLTTSNNSGAFTQIGFGSNSYATSNSAGKIKYTHTSQSTPTNDIMSFRVNYSDRMVINGSGNVGIGANSPAAKLDVAGGVKIANDTAAASATKVGTFRYRTSGNNSYVDMCMQIKPNSYEWVNIVTNSW